MPRPRSAGKSILPSFKRSRFCRLWVALLVVSMLLTSMPAIEVHAHGFDSQGTSGTHAEALDAHLSTHHSGTDQSGSNHLHESGLFGHGVAVSVDSRASQPVCTLGGEFPDPSALHPQTPSSRLLRPPAAP